MAEVPDTYRGRLSQFRILEESRHALIDVRSPAVVNSFFFCFALALLCVTNTNTFTLLGTPR